MSMYFWGHTPAKEGVIDESCLSNWYPSTICVGGDCYTCAEQYFMVYKARLFNDRFCEAMIRRETDPRFIKNLGREIEPFNKTLWMQFNEHALRDVLREKFKQNPEMREFLLTHEDYVEASPIDSLYGIGMGVDNPNIDNRDLWGLNLMGKALNDVREELL